jgi:hypothetical protein
LDPASQLDALRIAAHHEAGHAVIMWHHRHCFDSVCIYPDRPGMGRVQCRSVLDELPPQELWRRDETVWAHAAYKILQEVEWTLAGPLAEARYVNEPIGTALGSFDDVYEAIGLLGRLKHAELGRTRLMPKEIKEVYQHLTQAQERVEHLFSLPSVWRAVEALAAALVTQGHLAGHQAGKVIGHEDDGNSARSRTSTS